MVLKVNSATLQMYIPYPKILLGQGSKTVLVHTTKSTPSPRSCISAGLPGASAASLQGLLPLGPRGRRGSCRPGGRRDSLTCTQGASFVLLSHSVFLLLTPGQFPVLADVGGKKVWVGRAKERSSLRVCDFGPNLHTIRQVFIHLTVFKSRAAVAHWHLGGRGRQISVWSG